MGYLPWGRRRLSAKGGDELQAPNQTRRVACRFYYGATERKPEAALWFSTVKVTVKLVQKQRLASLEIWCPL